MAESRDRWIKNPTGQLIIAAEDGDVKAVVRLIEKDPGLVNAAEPEFGWTALHRAVQFGHTRLVRLLLKSGANPGQRDHKRNTPLHNAATGHDYTLQSLELLVKAGAPIESRNTYWETPIHVAVQHSNLPGFSFLLEQGARTDWRDRQGLDALGMAKYQAANVHSSRKYDQQRRELKAIIEMLEDLNSSK